MLRDLQRQIRGKNCQFCRKFTEIFEANFAEKRLLKNGRFHEFSVLIQEYLVVFGCSLIAVTKFHNKFASLWQVNSHNSQDIDYSLSSQDKFQICCSNIDVFGTISSEFCVILRVFVNFVG